MSTSLLTRQEMARVAEARFAAITQAPYLATALAAMTFIRQPGIETVAVDTRLRVYVDPAVLEKWSTTELAGALLHEVHHVIRRHHHRQSSARVDHALWNIAADVEINDDLLRAGVELPAGALSPSTFELPAHELAEWYAERLLNRIGGCQNRDCGSGAGGVVGRYELGDDADYPGLGPAHVDRIRDLVAQAVCAGNPGTIPGGLERWAHAHLRSQVQWTAVLTAVVRRALPRGVGHRHHTWSRPRRHNPSAAILPTLRGVPVHIAVIVDSSGSMSQQALDEAASDIASLTAVPNVSRVTVVSCDTEAVEVSTPAKGASLALVGGGGTNLGAGLEYVASLRRRADLLVVITDGFTSWPDSRPPRVPPIVVLIPPTGSQAPAWATTIVRQ